MQVGDLVKYNRTEKLHLVVWSDGIYCSLTGFPDNQIFKIADDHLEVLSESR